jgi:Zn-dependent protease with chaperone function
MFFLRDTGAFEVPYGLPILLLAVIVVGGCATTTYTSPAPTAAEVADVRAQVASVNPDRATLSLAEASDLAKQVFRTMSDDAAMICRTVAEADTCAVPALEVVDMDHVNARAGYDLQNDPKITLTRGLVEYLADQPDELALVIGHEYGHLIAAHVTDEAPGEPKEESTLGAFLSILAAASIAVATDGQIQYTSSSVPNVSQKQVDEYLKNTADPLGAYVWFTRAEELEADYIGTYLATRNGYAPTGSALIEVSALDLRDGVSPGEKQDMKVSYSYWDTHPVSPDRVARIQETLQEIEALKKMGYARPIPPALIERVRDNNESLHSLEELIAPR